MIILWELLNLWVFFIKKRCLVSCCEFFSFCTFTSPLSQRFIHFFSLTHGLPSPLTCTWSSQSSYHLVFLIIFVCFLCTLGALDPCCTLCMHLVLSILFAHFPCVLNAFNILRTCLVLLILFACFLPMPNVFDFLCMCLILCLLHALGPLSPIFQH